MGYVFITDYVRINAELYIERMQGVVFFFIVFSVVTFYTNDALLARIEVS